jgi:hypothetical protein
VMMVWMWAGSCVGVHGFLWYDLVCWSLDILCACLQCHFCGVGVGRYLVFVSFRVGLGLFILSYCDVSKIIGVRGWSCVVVLCACRQLFFSLSPPSWGTVSVDSLFFSF